MLESEITMKHHRHRAKTPIAELDNSEQIRRVSMMRINRFQSGSAAMCSTQYERPDYSLTSAFTRGVIDGFTSPLQVFSEAESSTGMKIKPRSGVGRSFRTVGSALNMSLKVAIKENDVRRKK